MALEFCRLDAEIESSTWSGASDIQGLQWLALLPHLRVLFRDNFKLIKAN